MTSQAKGNEVSVPEFYQSSVAEVERFLGGLKRGQVTEIARSPGGRAVYAVAYGEKEPLARTANLSSALAGRKPEAFFGRGRKRQVMTICSAMHGGEMESIAAVLNLFSVLETGKDRKGVAWPALREHAEGLRLVVIPCLNPDGRARIPVDDPTVWTKDEFEKYRHGLWPDGTKITWPAVKAWHPFPLEKAGFLGGYFNDAGVNPMHALWMGPDVAPETCALKQLVLAETPHAHLDLHSCEPGPFFIVGDPWIPEWMRLRQFYIEGWCRQMLLARDLRPKTWISTGGADRPSVIDINGGIHHLTGALPLLFEGGDGGPGHAPNTHTEIVDAYLTTFEGLFTIGVREGFVASR
jgi:hypothetical protein